MAVAVWATLTGASVGWNAAALVYGSPTVVQWVALGLTLGTTLAVLTLAWSEDR